MTSVIEPGARAGRPPAEPPNRSGPAGDAAPQGPARGGRRRRLTVDARKDELIVAAIELFSHRPAAEVSIDDIAAAADASRTLVFRYFRNKHELYLAAMRRTADQLSRRIAPPPGQRPLAGLAASLDAYFDFVEQHAPGFLMLVGGGRAIHGDEVGQIAQGVRETALGYLLRELAVDKPTPMLRSTLRAWIAAVETAGLDLLENRDLDRARLQTVLVCQCIAMLRVAGALDARITPRAGRPGQHLATPSVAAGTAC